MVKAEKLKLFFEFEANSQGFLCLSGTAATGMHRAAHARHRFHPIGEVVYAELGPLACKQNSHAMHIRINIISQRHGSHGF